MSTPTILPATPAPAREAADNLRLSACADQLVTEIERYLAARTRTTAPTAPAPATAHHLVTRTTADLVAEALAALAPASETAAPVADVKPPAAWLRRLPDWCLPLLGVRHDHRGRTLPPAEYLELTALVVDRFGWPQGRRRADCGARCIDGALFPLHRLGYGDLTPLRAAATLLHREAGGSVELWNDAAGRTKSEVLALIRRAADRARQGAVR